MSIEEIARVFTAVCMCMRAREEKEKGKRG